jgi:PST family polysaccharide transporter
MGAWSLVIGQIGGMVVSVLFTFLGARWAPCMGFDAETARQLIGFGWQMSMVDLCSAIVLNADYLFVGRFLGAEDLGLYSLAFRLPDTTIVAVAFAVAQLLLPAYVKLGAAAMTLRSGFVETTRYLGMALVPATAGLIVLAPVLVEALFGPRWQHSAPLVQFLAASALIRALVFAPGAIFVSSGRPALAMASELWAVAVSVPLFYLAAQRDVLTVAAVQLLTAGAYGVVKLSLLKSLIGISWTSMARPLGPATLASLVMVVVLAAALRVPVQPGVAWLAVSGVVLGAIVYGLSLWLLDRRSILRVAEIIRGRGTPAVGLAS